MEEERRIVSIVQSMEEREREHNGSNEWRVEGRPMSMKSYSGSIRHSIQMKYTLN